mmetsp:Transcript_5221/g.14020  ORF Transcript_5221/g.14020 Transcript_5221/m.14020 type:complete len:136 (+) Transcript_5221:1005-1412(+)
MSLLVRNGGTAVLQGIRFHFAISPNVAALLFNTKGTEASYFGAAQLYLQNAARRFFQVAQHAFRGLLEFAKLTKMPFTPSKANAWDVEKKSSFIFFSALAHKNPAIFFFDFSDPRMCGFTSNKMDAKRSPPLVKA